MLDYNDDTLMVLQGKSALYRLLSRMLYCEPSLEQLDLCVTHKIFYEAPYTTAQITTKKALELLKDWTVKNQDGLSENNYAEIKRDYLYLFIGVSRPQAPLWESDYFNDKGMLFGKETLSVRDAYKHYGFECAKKNREPDDQLGIELEFIARLFDMALEALQSGNEARAQELLLSKQQFIEEHLARWIPRWNELVQQHACTSFYRGIAFLVLGAIEEDLSPCCA